MEILFGNKGIHHYVDVRVGDVTVLEETGRMYQVNMLVENNLPFIFHSDILCMNGELWLTHNTGQCYNFNSMLLQGSVNGRVLRILMKQIMDCIKELGTYLLDASDLIMSAEYMFWDPVSETVCLLCVPGYNIEIREQFRLFLESIMPRFDHTDRSGEQFLYECYQVVTDDCRTLADFFSFLEHSFLQFSEISESNKKEVFEERISDRLCRGIISNEEIEDNAKVSTKESLSKESLLEEKTGISKRFLLFILAGGSALALIIKYLFFDGTMGTAIFGIGWLLALIILAILTIREKEDDSETAMKEYAGGKLELELESESSSKQDSFRIDDASDKSKNQQSADYFIGNDRGMSGCSKLVPLTNGALKPLHIQPSMPVVTVGRDRKTDYRVTTTQISRVHARLYNKTDGLFLEDLNSTNGTFLNAERIVPQTEYKLNRGDIVGFANEEFFVS